MILTPSPPGEGWGGGNASPGPHSLPLRGRSKSYSLTAVGAVSTMGRAQPAPLTPASTKMKGGTSYQDFLVVALRQECTSMAVLPKESNDGAQCPDTGMARIMNSSNSGTVNAISPWAGL